MKRLLPTLIHRGGLHAQILSGARCEPVMLSRRPRSRLLTVADEQLLMEPLAIGGYVLHLCLDPVFYGIGQYGLA